MGAAASAASPPPEAADPPPKEDTQPAAAAAADAPPEASAPADSAPKEEIQPAAPAPGGDAEAEGETVVFDAAAAEAGGEEEVGECPFCTYMKGGGCKDEFVEWEKCIEVAEAEGGDIVERCAKATTALRVCMDKFPVYYEPILSAERRMSEDMEAAVKEEAQANQTSPASPPAVAGEGEQGDSKKQPEEVVVVKEKEAGGEAGEQGDSKKQAEEEVVALKEKEDLAA
ncbi:brain acid soluble protein 1-like [Lolium rigidum]|uniref:brain acid soluble protein 1-like n=1 Tax=Lolium rigidum TaxID=89674 RepID=UPI001F5D2AC6|nr:brain acid soluble protein 1-like [Lolium rigidum]